MATPNRTFLQKKLNAMKKLLLTAVFAAVLISAADAQRKKNLYPDAVQQGEKLLNHGYLGILVRTADGLLVSRTFHPEKKVMTHSITYSSLEPAVKNGPYYEWYDNGNPWMAGAYQNDQEEGLWAYYDFETGQKNQYGNYAAGKKHGKWVTLDSFGNPFSEETFADGKRDGETRIYDKDGTLAIWRVYEKGQLIAEERFETSAPIDTTKMVQALPFLKGCESANLDLQKQCSEQKLLQSIYSRITYPPKARSRGAEGKAIFQFVVEKDGSISEMATLRGICADIEAECLRVLQKMPEWNPGRMDGVPVRVQYRMPILFRLE